MIDALTVERIVEAAKIVDVVSDYVSLRRSGANYTGLCPFHNERSPSFSVSPARGICKCFSCGKGGNAVHFIMELEQLTYFEALKFLAKKYRIEIQEREESEQERTARTVRESLFLINEFAQDLFVDNLFQSQEGQSIGLSYFRERGFREDIIRKFKLGYALESKDHFTKRAVEKGYKLDFLGKTGLTIVGENGYVVDRFRGRVIFPVHTISGKVVAFGGRILKKKDNVGKYVNSPESEIYSKRQELYGLYQSKSAIVKHNHCFMVEGYTDVISMHQSGIENVVSSSGTALTENQIRKIRQYTPNMTVLYDGDTAGIKASIRGIDLLLKEGMLIKVVLLPEGEDPDSFSRSRSSTEFAQFIKDHEVDFIRFKTNLMLKEVANDPIKKAVLVNDIVASIACIPDAVHRSIYIQESSDHLNVSESIIMDAVNKLIAAQLSRVEKRQSIDSTSSNVQSKSSNSIQQVPFPPIQEEGGLNIVQGVEPISSSSQATGAMMASPFNEASNLHIPLSQFDESFFAALPRHNMSRRLKCEVALIRYIVRFGDLPMFLSEDEQGVEASINVIQYIGARMQEEQLSFSNEVYTHLLEQAIAHYEDEGFKASRFFILHSNERISKLSAELSFDKHQLSKVHTRFQKVETEEERLCSLVIRAMTEFMDVVLDEKIDLLKERLRGVSEPELSLILAELQEMIQKKTILVKHIGDRVVHS